MTSANGFSNGLAFVTFQDDTSGKKYSGYIDTSGKLRNYIEGSVSDSQNGYMYLKKDNVFTVITPDGKTTAYEFSTDGFSNGFDVRYGDGYVVTGEYKASFEAVEFIYHIYDDMGNELFSYSSGSSWANGMAYIGERTFWFGDNLSQQMGGLYFAKSNTWLKGSFSIIEPYQDGVLMLNSDFKQFTYANSSGECQTVTIPSEYGRLKYLSQAGGMMLFIPTDVRSDFQFAFYCYDTGTGSWNIYQGQYADSVGKLVVGDGHIAFSLKGADDLYYTFLLDKNMADILDAPVLGSPTAIWDGVLYTKDDKKRYYYDLEGKLLMEMESSNVSSSGEGIIFTKQGEFLKTDGTPAFSEIDFSTGRLITLP